MLSKSAVFLRTNINVPLLKEYLAQTQALAQLKAQTQDDVHSEGSKQSEGDQARSATGGKRVKTASNVSQSRAGSAHPDAGGKNKRKFDRVLSKKAIQLGNENGITAEFICQ